jgi:hypothetical protein
MNPMQQKVISFVLFARSSSSKWMTATGREAIPMLQLVQTLVLDFGKHAFASILVVYTSQQRESGQTDS